MPSKKQTQPELNARREWRDIQQAEHRRSTTGVARRRKWVRIARWSGIVLLAASLVAGAVYAFNSAANDKHSLETVATLRKVTFLTDGVLNDQWLGKVLDLKDGIPLSSIDIAALRQKVEKQGQIKSASVTLRLPDRLLVEVREYAPLMRARAQVAPNDVRTLLISREGVVYEGANYPANTIRALPYIDGVTLRMVDGAFASLGNLEPVAAFLDKARMGWPKLYSDWRSVSLARYRGQDSSVSFIDVGSRSMGTIIFSVTNVEDQLRRLDKLIRDGGTSGGAVLKIDLSIPGQATVEYDKSTSKSKGR